MERKHRLTKREYFSQVYKYGKSAANHQFVLYSLPRPKQEDFRFGLSVSKKLGKAVKRNKLRRRLKEIARHHADHLPKGHDFILIARRPAAEMTYQELEKSFLHVLKRAKLTSSSAPGKPIKYGNKPS